MFTFQNLLFQLHITFCQALSLIIQAQSYLKINIFNQEISFLSQVITNSTHFFSKFNLKI